MRYSKGVYIWLNFFYEYRDWRVLFCRRDNNRKCVCATLCLLCLMSNASYSGTLVNQKQLKEIVKENCLRTRQILSVLKMKIYWMWLLWVLVFAKKRPKKKIPQQEQCTHYRKDAGSEIPQYCRIFDSACSDCWWNFFKSCPSSNHKFILDVLVLKCYHFYSNSSFIYLYSVFST